MPSQSREGYFPRARGGVYPKSDPIVAGATRAAGLLTHLLLHHEEPSRGSGPIYRYQEIEVKNEDKTKPGEAALEEVEAALAYPPNNALLGSSSIRVPFPSACGSTTLS